MANWVEMARRLDPSSMFAQIDASQMGIEDSRITNEVDVSRWRDVKRHARKMHRTQVSFEDTMTSIPREMLDRWMSTEYYALVAGQPLPKATESRGDLFAGLRPQQPEK